MRNFFSIIVLCERRSSPDLLNFTYPFPCRKSRVCVVGEPEQNHKVGTKHGRSYDSPIGIPEQSITNECDDVVEEVSTDTAAETQWMS
jgi:hypothetical protein